ncbi:MAG TPA: FesM [Terriglobia bacterium]|nr:FesM [Terriglobia bacterium]
MDLLRVPVLGRFLRWRHARTALQIPVFVISILMVLHGLFGPDLAPRNLATTLTWVHFRGAMVLVLLVAGNFFCMACPFMLPRQVARHLFLPRLNWPRKLRNKWLSVSLFIGILFAYELFDLWASPWWTAWLILAYFVGALAVDSVFKHASFCKFVCPIGQFNFVASTISPLEVQVRDQTICDECETRDCIRGRREPENGLNVFQRGCELALFQPLKAGNMDCTFCLDCVQACPHDNVGILSRVPAKELTLDPRRSGIGLFSRRKDLAALAILFCFGALLNAFGMVTPVYAVQSFLAGMLGLNQQAPVLGIIFMLFLVVEPVVLLGLAAWLTRKWSGSSTGILPLIVRYAYGIAPLGFGVWLSHYSFHFFNGLFTFVPVFQSAAARAGLPFLGEPRWNLGGLPESATYVIGMGFLMLGLIGSLMVIYRIAGQELVSRPIRAFAPWAGVCLILWLSAVWLMSQPMQMRGTFLAQ